MNQTVKGVLISVVLSFTIPTLVVASQWGGIKANQAELIRQLGKIEYKIDKIEDKVNDTREEVSQLKGRISK